jgi:hypothetical protein
MNDQVRIGGDPREAFDGVLDDPTCWQEWNEYLDRVEAEYGDEEDYIRESGMIDGLPDYSYLGS